MIDVSCCFLCEIMTPYAHVHIHCVLIVAHAQNLDIAWTEYFKTSIFDLTFLQEQVPYSNLQHLTLVHGDGWTRKLTVDRVDVSVGTGAQNGVTAEKF